MSDRISSLALAAAVAALLALSTFGAQADSIAASGDFRGATGHATSGGVSIVKRADGGYSVVLGDDFSFDGAPNPRVGLGRNVLRWGTRLVSGSHSLAPRVHSLVDTQPLDPASKDPDHGRQGAGHRYTVEGDDLEGTTSTSESRWPRPFGWMGVSS